MKRVHDKNETLQQIRNLSCLNAVANISQHEDKMWEKVKNNLDNENKNISEFQ